MLTKRQQLTIQHLKEFQGITSSDEIIAFCVKKLKQPNDKRHRLNSRKHSKDYYRQIVLHFRRLDNPPSGREGVR